MVSFSAEQTLCTTTAQAWPLKFHNVAYCNEQSFPRIWPEWEQNSITLLTLLLIASLPPGSDYHAGDLSWGCLLVLPGRAVGRSKFPGRGVSGNMVGKICSLVEIGHAPPVPTASVSSSASARQASKIHYGFNARLQKMVWAKNPLGSPPLPPARLC